MDPITILAALGPLLVEGGKAAISRWLAPESFKPSTIEQWSSMQEMQLKLFEAMNTAGGANPSYQWVEAIVRLQRPFVAAVVLLAWAYMHWTLPLSDLNSVDNFASAVGFYLFGDRTLFYAKQGAVTAK